MWARTGGLRGSTASHKRGLKTQRDLYQHLLLSCHRPGTVLGAVWTRSCLFPKEVHRGCRNKNSRPRMAASKAQTHPTVHDTDSSLLGESRRKDRRRDRHRVGIQYVFSLLAPTITTCSHHHYRSPSVPPSNLNANVTSSEMASRSFSGKQTECCPPGCKFWEGGGLLWTLAQKTRLTVLLEGEQEGSWKMK